MASREIFVTNLNSLLSQADWNQSQLGEKLGVSQVQAGKYLKGKSSPPFEILDRIGSLFGIKVSDVFKEDTVPEANIIKPTPEEALRILSEEVRQLRILESVAKMLSAVCKESKSPEGKTDTSEFQKALKDGLRSLALSPGFQELAKGEANEVPSSITHELDENDLSSLLEGAKIIADKKLSNLHKEATLSIETESGQFAVHLLSLARTLTPEQQQDLLKYANNLKNRDALYSKAAMEKIKQKK